MSSGSLGALKARAVTAAKPWGKICGPRTLATTALPAGATCLEAWRTSPGSMPEFLHTSARGETQVIISVTITFTPGGLYQLWIVAINSKGKSPAGPVQNWNAV